MTEDERLEELLRRALAGEVPPSPTRDLWPLIRDRSRPTRVSWLDLGLVALLMALLLARPDWLPLLAFHL